MVPAALAKLEKLAYNLWWSWDVEATRLWERIDAHRWSRNRHNPVGLLLDVERERWDELAADRAFVADLDSIHARFEAYLAAETWADRDCPPLAGKTIAYFSMEFGLHESLRLYSGGLGVLAGDHLRSASDLGVPLVAVGFLYREGYFRQVIDEFRQIAAYPINVYERLPIRLCVDDAGLPIAVNTPIADRLVSVRVWRLDVGRVPLYLLDVDHSGNEDADRELTRHLYGGDATTRVHQEVLLGVGGVRALRALGLKPDLYHLNEGHCAFVSLQLIADALGPKVKLEQAIEKVRPQVVFTTHTPVPAGHDRFGWDLVDGTLGAWRAELGLDEGAIMDLGRVRIGDMDESLCMTVVALRTASAANGVAALHGRVSREMWRDLWPDKAVDDVPIGHVTNGVHPTFWTAPAARALFDERLPGWRERPWDPAAWAPIASVPDTEIWSLRRRLRAALLDAVKQRTGKELDPDALTIGFARRFAPYKRGDLLFREPERLRNLLERTPAQLVYAGKAHPKDEAGKEIIGNVIRWATAHGFRDRIVFIEDYDLVVGRLITSGADVWLNNPRRPHEASGTSGQKVVLNGGLNLSVLDGWWPEGFDGTNGWAIGNGEEWPEEQTAEQDATDAASLYRLLEEDVVGEWLDRDASGVPRKWIHRIKRSIATCAPKFTSHRMVRDYALDWYAPRLGK